MVDLKTLIAKGDYARAMKEISEVMRDINRRINAFIPYYIELRIISDYFEEIEKWELKEGDNPCGCGKTYCPAKIMKESELIVASAKAGSDDDCDNGFEYFCIPLHWINIFHQKSKVEQYLQEAKKKVDEDRARKQLEYKMRREADEIQRYLMLKKKYGDMNDREVR